MTKPFIGQIVHYVMEGKDANHVAGIVAYIDPDKTTHVNLCIPCGSKKGKGFTPATLAYTDVEYDAGAERVMTWHYIEGQK
jgi:hypothetical protein